MRGATTSNMRFVSDVNRTFILFNSFLLDEKAKNQDYTDLAKNGFPMLFYEAVSLRFTCHRTSLPTETIFHTLTL